MQNVEQSENSNIDKVNVQLDVVKSSTPHSSSSSPAKSETETYSEAPAKYMTDSSESEDDSVSEAEIEDEGAVTESSKFLLSHNDPERAIDPDMQARIEALLETAGIGKLSNEGKHLADPEALRRLTSSVSYALDEAAAALTRMRSDQPPQHHRHHQEKPTQCAPTSTTSTTTTPAAPTSAPEGAPSLAEACSDGDVGTVRKLLTEGRSVHETTEEGESLLSLACSAGYYELAQVLLAMHANVEDRGIKGDCTPLMEAASVGHVEIVRLLVAHGADVNAVSGTGNTPLMYACAGGHEDCVKALIESGANVEDHNENGHTPLMEAASAGQVGVAKILLEHGAGINTHSNEFKESALTLACYKGHLDMVRFLLAAGADREHKTDEMHTALMEASMDGHVEVARLLLDSGAQVNMPTDSFESPLTLAACGGHVELAMLLLERGANIEEVNDEGYTPLMEAAREGHEEMVALLLGQGASINAQTEETQETALTLACCGGFMEVADFLIKAGADIELGASTPLMEASQEGHLELVRYLLANGADVRAVTATGDCALSYACENGHTDVAQVLLRGGAALEHESEGGRTPLMKACRASHLCTVQFLVSQGADVNRTTRSGDHTPLSLACAGGHLEVVKFLLACEADPFAKLKDNSSTLIEAARGGHTAVVQLLLDYPHSVNLPRAPHHHNGLNNANAHQTNTNPDSFTIGFFKGLQYNSNKNKIARKLRTIAHDHRLPPPPDIANEQVTNDVALTPPPGFTWKDISKKFKKKRKSYDMAKPDLLAVAQPNNKLLPETERNLELPENPGPPSLATSALQALDLQFNAQGLTTQQPEPPHLPPLFPVQQNTVNATQQQMQQLQQHQLKTQHQCIELAEQYVQNQECGASPCGDSRELAAVLAYLQREVPSLVALPPDELRSLVVQVMQQKSHEILYRGDAVAAPDDPKAKQLLDEELAMIGSTDWPGQRPRPGETITEQERPENPSEPRLQKTYEEYRKTSLTCSGKHEAPSVKKKAKARATARTNNRPTQTNGALDLDAETESNHDTALTLACAGGHEELVQLLLARGAHIEHRDKKGFTPLILAATAGHVDIVELLLDIGADIEAQSERTKDTPLSLACSGGRYEVVELLLNRGANKEHRNVSDYTPLSLAASGGFVNIIRMLLHHQAEINSRTGSKLGISPLMLAAMNGHTAAVRLLLDCGSDINAQIETNRNTALTLACFQGRHEVVSLLLERRANAEHRAKTGLTPLMEAASGGYVDVGRVLLDKGADVNAPPVPSSRDTALTIAADKGHVKFVELLLKRGAAVEVKNKKGNSPLWLAANGGHLMVVELLYAADADIESQDNRKVSCLMAAFRKGHTKVVKWMVDIVRQFPSDQEMTRFVCTINDKELLEKCQECMRLIRAAKETQAARANQNATILLEELESERCREESRRLAAARRREKKKKKKMEKKEERRKQTSEEKPSEECSEAGELEEEPVPKEEDSGIDANSQGSCSSSDVKGPPPNPISKTKKKKKEDKSPPSPTAKKQPDKPKPKPEVKPEKEIPVKIEKKVEKENVAPIEPVRPTTPKKEIEKKVPQAKEKWESEPKSTSPKSAPASARREEGWKEVVRKSSVQTISTVEPGCKRVSVTSHAISRVIGRAGSNINAIRSATGAHIEVDKQTKGQADRIITIKGSAEATKQAANLIAAMIRDPDADISLLLPRAKPIATTQPLLVKTVKQVTPKQQVTPVVGVCVRPSSAASVTRKTQPIARPTLPTRPQPQQTSGEKRMSSPVSSKSGSYNAVLGARAHSFAAKLTNTTTPEKLNTSTHSQMSSAACVSNSSPGKQPMRELSNETTPYKMEEDKNQRVSAHLQLSPENTVGTWNTNDEIQTNTSTALHINTQQTVSTSGAQEYSLFKDLSSVGAGVWAVEHNSEFPPPQQRVDLSKAPGYRGGCSPCSRTSSHGSTPPPQNNHYNDTLHAIGSTVNAMDLSGLSRNGPIYQDPSRNGHNLGMVSMASGVGMSSSSLGLGYMGVSGVDSRLNPRAPDYTHHKPTSQLSYASGSNNANLSNLLMSYQQQPTHKPMPVHPYQSLLERGVGVSVSNECEERKPRPIGTERAWKLTAPDEWNHQHHHVSEHDRYQQQQNVPIGGVDGFSGTGATAAALSLMQALPLQYLPQNHDHNHWDNHQHDKQQTWNKWTH